MLTNKSLKQDNLYDTEQYVCMYVCENELYFMLNLKLIKNRHVCLCKGHVCNKKQFINDKMSQTSGWFVVFFLNIQEKPEKYTGDMFNI